ncbi:hypothetical protein [Deinococcus pimensis]|uniref:hypothetical protein n=1 Tax=Deinococcus pimensis TaxID=309888 RepID=UPI000481A56C|nr:hypothetical protein [Deinococcus pimensis]
MDIQTLFSSNADLIRSELARVDARPPAIKRRFVDQTGWRHDCSEEDTVVIVHATHEERLCCRCGYRAYLTLEGERLGHHGGHGLLILRRADHAHDIVLTDVQDRNALEYVLTELAWGRDPYATVIAVKPWSEDYINVFRGHFHDLDDTPLRSYFLAFRRAVHASWDDWRRIVFVVWACPSPPRAPFGWTT